MEQKKHADILLSVIVPAYNEALGLKFFHDSLSSVLKNLGSEYEILYIDDGSKDGSPSVIRELADNDAHVKPLFLSRNFGKEAATSAGLYACQGAAAMMIDADGQHPVQLIPEFVRHWRDGAKVVVGVRISNQREGFVKRYGSKLFYGLLRSFGVYDIVPGATDFRLVDAEVVAAFRKLSEHNRITRALIDWLGFERDYIHFHANAREHGEPSYSVRKLIQLALNGFVSLSFAPLYFSAYLGGVIVLISFLASLFAVIEKYSFHDPLHLNITGTAILAILILFLVGILLICQGILAVYIARIYTEVQGRPLYVLKDKD